MRQLAEVQQLGKVGIQEKDLEQGNQSFYKHTIITKDQDPGGYGWFRIFSSDNSRAEMVRRRNINDHGQPASARPISMRALQLGWANLSRRPKINSLNEEEKMPRDAV